MGEGRGGRTTDQRLDRAEIRCGTRARQGAPDCLFKIGLEVWLLQNDGQRLLRPDPGDVAADEDMRHRAVLKYAVHHGQTAFAAQMFIDDH